MSEHFASRDTWCTLDAVARPENAKEPAGQKPEIHRYEADHPFFNKLRPPLYDPQAVELFRRWTVASLKKYL